MAEDVYSQTVAPGMSELTSFSARGWLEHRSRVGPYKAACTFGLGCRWYLRQPTGWEDSCCTSTCMSTTSTDRAKLGGPGQLGPGHRAQSRVAATLLFPISTPTSRRRRASILTSSRPTLVRAGCFASSGTGRLPQQRKGLNKKGSEAEDSSPSPPRRQPKPKPKAKAASAPEA